MKLLEVSENSDRQIHLKKMNYSDYGNGYIDICATGEYGWGFKLRISKLIWTPSKSIKNSSLKQVQITHISSSLLTNAQTRFEEQKQ